MLLQSCVAYQKTSVSLNEATNRGKVKIVDTHGSAYHLQNVEMKDSIYYASIKGKQTILYEAQIASIYLHDKKKSTWITIIVVATPLLIFSLVAMFALWNGTFGRLP